jgi:hypothetical protein
VVRVVIDIEKKYKSSFPGHTQQQRHMNPVKVVVSVVLVVVARWASKVGQVRSVVKRCSRSRSCSLSGYASPTIRYIGLPINQSISDHTKGTPELE